MNPYGHSPEPPDTREEPECICPVEGPECQECPAHYLAAIERYSAARGRLLDFGPGRLVVDLDISDLDAPDEDIPW